MADGPVAGLAIADGLDAGGALARSHQLPAVRAERLTRLGRSDEARAEYGRAASLCDNEAERAMLEQKANA